MAVAGTMVYPAHEGLRNYSSQQMGAYPVAAQDPRNHALSSMPGNPYTDRAPVFRQHPHHRSPPEPVVMDNPDRENLKLPPISKLLDYADIKTAHSNMETSRPNSRNLDDRIPVHPSRSPYTAPHVSDRRPSPPSRPSWIDDAARQMPDQAHNHPPNNPPFRYNPAGDRPRSPSPLSTGSTSSLPPYLAPIGAKESRERRADSMHAVPGNPAAVQPAASSASKPPAPTSSPYMTASTNQTRYPTSYPSPDHRPAPSEDPYQQQQQRPLPPNFPPPHALAPPSTAATTPPVRPQPQTPAAAADAAAAAAMEQPWQTQTPQTQQQQQHHHHYMSPSSASAQASTSPSSFSASQDRYICPTCNKAFSRPSSLKIHSHSHTGEKPFRCNHDGCGKAFSVRSNMKRHERGCHTGIGGAYPGAGATQAGSGTGEDVVMGEAGMR